MLGTSETPYDLRFRFLGVPVRIHPIFWLISAALGWHDHDIPLTLLWVVCVLVSILVHEFGHALANKAFHSRPWIVLWGLGGLCYSDGERQTPMQRLAVILAGPGAGFVLGGLVLVATSLLCGISASEQVEAMTAVLTGSSLPGEVVGKLRDAVGSSEGASTFLRTAYRALIWINFMWGFVNLLPLWPLDGGQATQIVLSFFDRSRGPRWAHVVSLLVAGGLTILVATLTKELFLALFFGSFAFINYQALQSIHESHAAGLYQEDDWWKR
jgi:membrane-associated protease RseP (regulator of RpoE activity)